MAGVERRSVVEVAVLKVAPGSRSAIDRSMATADRSGCETARFTE
jgi:hypothetical protein